MSTSSDPKAPERPFGLVAVLGLGVMGGSLARALSRLDDAPEIVGWSPDPTEREAAVAAGAVARAPEDWTEALDGAELVVLATPLGATCRMMEGVGRTSGPGTTITDVGSLKSPVAEAAASAGLASRWVGSHPMAGSERSGFEASGAGLYEGARVWTVADPTAAPRVDGLHALWRSVGADPRAITPEAHDRLVAVASHLPQLASNAIASVLEKAGVARDQVGPGGVDMTRLAESGPGMWLDLFAHAPPELADSLRALSMTTERIADLLEAGDLEGLEELMRATSAWRRS